MDFFIASFIQNIANFFIQGGFFMILLLLLSLVSGTVIILRAAALREKSVLPPELEAEVDRLQPGDTLEELQNLIERHPSPLARILHTLLRHLYGTRSEAIEAVQTRARHEVAHLERGMIILEITTGIAPLLGLLGTLSGLVSIFANVGSDPVSVARGIAEALNTTIMGLAVAVPSLIMYNYFMRRIEIMSVEMESLVSDLIAKCYPQGSSPVVEEIS